MTAHSTVSTDPAGQHLPTTLTRGVVLRVRQYLVQRFLSSLPLTFYRFVLRSVGPGTTPYGSPSVEA